MITKKILIICDNYPLSEFLLNLKKKKISFELFHSKTSSKLTKIGSVFINLKRKQTQNKILKNFKTLISVHCHTIIPELIIDKILCINFHPGYNPYNRGMFPQIFSIINNKPLGATVHLMTKKIDNGPIIERKKIICHERDTSYELYNKIIELQKKLIKKNIPKIINNNFKLKKINQIGNYNSKKDFSKICNLNLDKKDTFRNHIKILKALSHKGFKNAYYIKNKKKVFIEINFL